MEIAPDIEPTGDGSATLRHPVFLEKYHSSRGAMGESLHIFIHNGLETIAGPHVNILEVGFGTGLNAWLTLENALKNGRTIDYQAIELYPICNETASRLGYTDNPLFMDLHRAGWGARTEITPGFSITKSECDLEEAELIGKFDLVYFDAFAPDVQPSLWNLSVFERLYCAMNPGGALVTYSVKGTVKRALREAGFSVKRLPGALGKRHMLRAVKE